MEMLAEPVVSLVVESLGRWLSEEAKLLYRVPSEVSDIRDELRRMSCFLIDADADELQKEGERVRNWVAEIREIAYDAEDAVETFLLRVAFRGDGIPRYVERYVCFVNECADRHNVGSQIKAIKSRVSVLTSRLQTYGVGSGDVTGSASNAAARQQKALLRRSYSHVVEKDFVGLEEEVKKLVEYLVEEDKHNYQTVSVCGMGGLGKTTLAQKVYSHPNVKHHFKGFAWVCVSQRFQKKDLLKDILIKLVPEEMIEIIEIIEEQKEEDEQGREKEGEQQEERKEDDEQERQKRQDDQKDEDEQGRQKEEDEQDEQKEHDNEAKRELKKGKKIVEIIEEQKEGDKQERQKEEDQQDEQKERDGQNKQKEQCKKETREVRRRKKIIDMREQELVKLLYKVLQEKKCLVVVDDIWTTAAWDELRQAFPVGDMSSKILLTTRNKEVASYVDPNGFCYEPRLLTDDEGWELLHKKAFIRRDGTDLRHDKSVEELGKKMVRRCRGLPLAVIVVGGILVTKKTLREWNDVYENIGSYIRKGQGVGQQDRGVLPVLALSYNDLPHQLKQCFLYLSNFREDSEIGVENLYQMWIAEGMVLTKDQAERETLMDVAERYLGELALRCMVQVQADDTSGMFDSCSLHDLMLDLCLSKAKEENFLFRIHGKEKPAADFSNCKPRRLSIYLGKDDGELALPEPEIARRLRSAVVVFEPLCLHWMKSSHFKNFRMLRVLYLNRVNHSSSTLTFLGSLSHLRYLSIQNCTWLKFSPSIANLRCLQTLDLGSCGSYTMCEVPNVVGKMKSLRHLYLGYGNLWAGGRKFKWDGLSKLETLQISEKYEMGVGDICKLTNLRRFEVHLKVTAAKELKEAVSYLNKLANPIRNSLLAVHLKFGPEQGSLVGLGQLLESDRLSTLEVDGIIGEVLPELHHFSSSITTLKFHKSQLRKDPMPTLEMLQNLRRLYLYAEAFVGEEMVCSNKGFPQLKFLQLGELGNLKEWTVEEGSMPSLSTLEIAGCRRLTMIPEGLRSIATLQELKIRCMPSRFRKRLQGVDGKEGADLSKVHNVPSIIFLDYYYGY